MTVSLYDEPHSILCKVIANSNKLFLLFEAPSSFRFQYRLLTMTTFFEIAVYTCKIGTQSHGSVLVCTNLFQCLRFNVVSVVNSELKNSTIGLRFWGSSVVFDCVVICCECL